MEVRQHEGLEVYTDTASNAPEVYHNQGSKDPIMSYVQVVEAKKGPFGLSMWTLCTIVAVITALIVGAGVGGGLGAALAECKSSGVTVSSLLPAEPSACPTPTSTTGTTEETTASEFYKPEAPDQVANLTLPNACSEKNGKGTYTTNNGYVFTYTCGWDYPGNDIAPVIAYTAFDCMHACAMYTETHKGEENAARCDSIAFVRDMSTALKQHGANCWLKTGTRSIFPESDRLPRFLYAKWDS